MQNYQLYNTNILLGGQQKWDIVLESDGSLYIKDFHITPISDNISYNRKVDENLMNYSHQENLKHYYKNISSDFYNIGLDYEFNHMFPIESNKLYSDICISGVKRSKSYQLYKKQYELLCPVWFENIDGDISFIIEVKGHTGVTIATKTLRLTEKVGRSYHNKFISYLKKYIDYINLNNNPSDNCIYIDLENKKSYICGLEVKTGNLINKECNYVVDNLLSRERPLMENDFMLCSLYKNNDMIVRNLFNFNFCFNIEDIVSHTIEKELKGNIINITIKACVGGKELPIKSFFTNYESINRYEIINSNDIDEHHESNIFSYLNDYKYIDFIDINKFDPQICHWSINSNNDYIFNLYAGFGSFYIDRDKKNQYINNRYFNSPDLYNDKYDVYLNNYNWCNANYNFKLNDMNNFILEHTPVGEKNFEEISSNFKNKWINNVQYNDLNEEINNLVGDELYVYLGLCSSDELMKIRLFDGFVSITPRTLCNSVGNKLLIVSDIDSNECVFYSFRNILRNFNTDDATGPIDTINKIKYLKEKLLNIKFPKNIRFYKTIDNKIIDGPSISVKEIEYIKNDSKTSKTIQRYDGKLKPTFIDIYSDYFKNFIYYKKHINDIDKSILNIYSDKYKPIYPSIGYYFIEKRPIEYSKSDIIDLNNCIEYKWMNDSNVLVINDYIHKIITTSSDNIENDIKRIICESNNMGLENVDYLFSLYNYKYEKIEDEKYSIKIELK